jgi:hypothetical protein
LSPLSTYCSTHFSSTFCNKIIAFNNVITWHNSCLLYVVAEMALATG